jgi:hypothetical protein
MPRNFLGRIEIDKGLQVRIEKSDLPQPYYAYPHKGKKGNSTRFLFAKDRLNRTQACFGVHGVKRLQPPGCLRDNDIITSSKPELIFNYASVEERHVAPGSENMRKPGIVNSSVKARQRTSLRKNVLMYGYSQVLIGGLFVGDQERFLEEMLEEKADGFDKGRAIDLQESLILTHTAALAPRKDDSSDGIRLHFHGHEPCYQSIKACPKA